MKSRYTYKSLESDIAFLNQRLESAGADMRLVIGSSYNMTTVDLATPEQAARHFCQRRLTAGTPRECLSDCQTYVIGNI